MSRVVILSNISRGLPGWEEAKEMLRRAGHEVFDAGERDFNEDETIRYLGDADAVFVGFNKLSGNAIKSGKNLKVIAKPGVGVDNIDVDTATQEGIIVCNTPGSNAEPTADHLFGLMIALARKIPYLDRMTKAGQGWERTPPAVGSEIVDKTLGVIGTGSIGQAVIRRAKGFDMEILAFGSHMISDQKLIQDLSIKYLPLEDVLKRSDFVTLHVPLTHETRGLIGEPQLRLMKKTAYLFNTSRGSIVDEKALIRALKEGWINGAGLDVFEEEPLTESELFKLENVVVTPHTAGYSPEASLRARIMTAQNIIDAFQEIKPHIVNREVLKLSHRKIKLKDWT